MMTWEAALRARASGTGAEADAARLVLLELERLRRIVQAAREYAAVRDVDPDGHEWYALETLL